MLLIAPTQTEYNIIEACLRDSSSGGNLELTTCGIGPERSAAFCRSLDTRAHPPSALALLGVAGGLDPSLAAGEAVLANASLDEDGRRAPCTVIALPGAAIGLLLTVRRALYTPSEKAAGRATGALAVEMEAYPLAAWAAERRMPFIHARIILDPFDENLPDLGGMLDELGRARPAALFRQLAVHPAQAVSVAHLLRRTRAVAPALGRLAQLVVAVGG
jgi:nucleoside phosphorylase